MVFVVLLLRWLDSREEAEEVASDGLEDEGTELDELGTLKEKSTVKVLPENSWIP